MTQQEMIENLAATHGITKAKAGRIYKDVFANIQGTLLSENRCAVAGFGTFSVVQRAEKKGRNPQTGEELTIPARMAVKFKPSVTLKNAVQN